MSTPATQSNSDLEDSRCSAELSSPSAPPASLLSLPGLRWAFPTSFCLRCHHRNAFCAHLPHLGVVDSPCFPQSSAQFFDVVSLACCTVLGHLFPLTLAPDASSTSCRLTQQCLMPCLLPPCPVHYPLLPPRCSVTSCTHCPPRSTKS